MKKLSLFLLFVSISLINQAQPKRIIDDYAKLPILGFLLPENGLNKATYVYYDDKGNQMPKMTWHRYFVKEANKTSTSTNTKNDNRLFQLVEEQLYDSHVTSSLIKYILVDDREIRLLNVRQLTGTSTDRQEAFAKTTLLLVKPESEKVLTRWQRIDDDGAVVMSVANFADYPTGGKILPCIRVKETTVLQKANINTTKEYYYLYGLGYMGSSIFNKTRNELMFFDKLDDLTHDRRFEEDKPENTQTVIGSDSQSNLNSPEKKPTHVLSSKELYGTPGGAPTGVAFDVPGWSLAGRPNVDDNSDETGKIVFQLKVDGSGDIINVNQLQSTVSPSVSEVYRKAVQRLRLRPKNGVAPTAATGIITFIITSR